MRPGLVEIDLGAIRTVEQLHIRLGTELRFPDWWGRNWDAVWDCMTDEKLSSMPAVLRLSDWEVPHAHLPRDAQILRALMDDLARQRPDVIVDWA